MLLVIPHIILKFPTQKDIFIKIFSACQLYKICANKFQDKVKEVWADAQVPSFKEALDILIQKNVFFVQESLIEDNAWFDSSNTNFLQEFQKKCHADFCKTQISTFIPAFPEHLVMSAQSVRHHFGFNATQDQIRVLNVIANAPDESITVSAFAGTGKTHIIQLLKERFETTWTYIVPKAPQRNAVKMRFGAHHRTITLTNFVNEVAKSNMALLGIQSQKWIGTHWKETSLEEQAHWADISDLVCIFLPAKEVVKIACAAITRWCNTDDASINSSHFRTVYKDPAVIGALIASAEHIWKMMFEPPPGIGRIFSISTTHLIKWLVINNASKIPNSYGTLLVDESHDLLPSWYSFLQRYSGGCVLLGDPYQRIYGKAGVSGHAHQVYMSASSRVGLQGSEYVNDTLLLAPERLFDEHFTGSPGHVTRIQRYSPKNNLPMQGLRVYGSEWALLEDALRICEQGSKWRFLYDSEQYLLQVVGRARNLYVHQENSHAISVSGCNTWGQLHDLLLQQGRGNIIRLFERNFQPKDVYKMIDKQCPCGQEEIVLGLNEHSKNYEVDTVLLMPCCFTEAGFWRNYTQVHAVYLAMTRARYHLWLPGDCLERLASLQKRIDQ